jgi:type II secretory pathway component GspD/PulD (secretin)
LNLEQQRGTTEILQSPNVIVLDGEEASLVAGQTDSLPPTTAMIGNAVVSTPRAVDYNLTMKVTPHITADGGVQMKFTLDNNSPGIANPGADFARNNRSLTTNFLRRSGETAVIGGIYTNQTAKTVRGVPFFSEIPIIGALFRSTTVNDSKRELMVMVTPTILSTGKAAPSAAEEPSGNLASNDEGGDGSAGNDNTEGNANFGDSGDDSSNNAGNNNAGNSLGNNNSGNNNSGSNNSSNNNSGNNNSNAAANNAGNNAAGSNDGNQSSNDNGAEE